MEWVKKPRSPEDFILNFDMSAGARVRFLELRLITSYSLKGIITLNEAIAFNRIASVFLFFSFIK